MDVTIRVDDAEVRTALRRLRAAVDDLRPALREIAAALEAGVQDAFDAQESPAGDPWAPLAESTIRRRTRRRKWRGIARTRTTEEPAGGRPRRAC